MSTLLGLPSLLVAAVCAAIAVVWLVAWPRRDAAGAGRARYLVLRWGHAAVWLLLALAALLHSATALAAAKAAALAALAVYGAFLTALLSSDNRRRR